MMFVGRSIILKISLDSEYFWCRFFDNSGGPDGKLKIDNFGMKAYIVLTNT